LPIDGCRGLSRGVLLRAALDKSEGTSKSLRGWEMKTIKILVAILISYATVNLAQAETKYRNITISKTDYQTIDWNGGKVTIGTSKGIVSIIESSNQSLLGESNQTCFVRIVRIKDSSDVSGHCTATDKDGDNQYFVIERRQGDASSGSGGGGIAIFQGGTGKYQGISGSCNYTIKNLKDNWNISEATCVTK